MSRSMTPVALLLALLLFAPMTACRATTAGQGAAAPARTAAPAANPDAAGQPARSAATGEELERYAAREQRSAGLEKFEGGRIDTTAIIIILLLVIIIVLIV